MSLPYQMVFALLVFEMVSFGVLVIPFPHKFRKSMIGWLSRSMIVAQFIFMLKILFIFVFVLFIDSVNRMWKIQSEVDAEKDNLTLHHAQNDALLHSKLFYSQRNMYLTGFTLFLSVILNRFYVLICELIKNEDLATVVQKQAAGNTKQSLQLVTKLEDAEKEVKTLKAKLSSAEKKVQNADVVVHQADNNHKQYMELADKYAELEKKYALLQAKRQEETVSDTKKDK